MAAVSKASYLFFLQKNLQEPTYSRIEFFLGSLRLGLVQTWRDGCHRCPDDELVLEIDFTEYVDSSVMDLCRTYMYAP